MRSPVLGIDLGTTNTVVAVADAQEVRVLPGEDGSRLTPSVVSFHPGGDVLVGHTGKERRLVDAQNTVSSVKRLIGRPFRSPAVRRAADRFPFTLVEGDNGVVTVKARGQQYSLPEISAFVLRRAKGLAEAALQMEVTQAVVTVPANFNELQRTATRDAGRIAGLEVLRIINEPTAAALAYGYASKTRERVAVYDLGGGTFDVSILDLSGDVIEVLSTAGDTYLGGDDIDALIADRMAQAFLEEHRVDLAADAQANERLRVAAEWLKCQLSEREHAEVTVEEIAYGAGGTPLDLRFEMDAEAMEKLTFALVGRTFDICEEAMKAANVRPSQLDSVILVGGQTRMPQVRRMVAEYFGREPLVSVDPDEVVAQGAALQAYALSGLQRPDWKPRMSQPPPATASGHPQRPSFFPEAHSPSSMPPEGRSGSAAATLPRPPNIPGELPGPRAAGAARSTLSGFGEGTEPPPVPTQPGSARNDEPTVIRKMRPKMPSRDPFDERTLVRGDPRVDGDDDEVTRVSTGPVARPSAVGRVELKARAAPPAVPPAATEVRGPVIEGPGAAGDAIVRPKKFNTMPGISAPAGSAAPPPPPPASRHETRPPPLDAPPPPAISAPPPVPDVPRHEPSAVPPAPPPEASRAPALPLASESPPKRVSEPPPPPTRASEPPPRDEEQELPEALRSSTAPPASTGGREPSQSFSLSSLPPSSLAALDAEVPLTPQAGSTPPPPMTVDGAPLLLDVTPHTLGIETVGGYCEQVIERNAPIPTEQTRVFSTSQDDQVVVRMRVCQGEARKIDDNQVLGHLELLGLPKAPRGDVRIGVTFMLDANGTLQARAKDKATGKEQRIRINLVGALADDEIKQMQQRQAGMYSGG